jgi:hypothetical protein
VLQYHPGLEFLADTPEFQARYAETVIYRIFYTINRCAARRAAAEPSRCSAQLLQHTAYVVYFIYGKWLGYGKGFEWAGRFLAANQVAVVFG